MSYAAFDATTTMSSSRLTTTSTRLLPNTISRVTALQPTPKTADPTITVRGPNGGGTVYNCPSGYVYDTTMKKCVVPATANITNVPGSTLLPEVGIETDEPTTDPPPQEQPPLQEQPLDEEDNTALYVGGGLLLAAVLAGGYFYVTRKKR
jgi:hypothetical protein